MFKGLRYKLYIKYLTIILTSLFFITANTGIIGLNIELCNLVNNTYLNSDITIFHVIHLYLSLFISHGLSLILFGVFVYYLIGFKDDISNNTNT